MLKIYNAYNEQGNIKINDYICFQHGSFDTGLNGFGQVQSGNLECKKANYELQSLKYYRDYLNNVKITDGYVENFMIVNPYNYQMLSEQFGDITKDSETYEKYSLNEEGILLFTDFVNLKYNENDDSVQRIFGRLPESGLYLLKPNASIIMSTGKYTNANQESYEVLQSKNLGKQLVLSKMSRTI